MATALETNYRNLPGAVLLEQLQTLNAQAKDTSTLTKEIGRRLAEYDQINPPAQARDPRLQPSRAPIADPEEYGNHPGRFHLSPHMD